MCTFACLLVWVFGFVACCCRLAAPVVPSTGAASTSTLTSWEARGRCRAGIPQPAQRQRVQQLQTTTEGSGKLSWPVPRGGLPTAGNWPGVAAAVVGSTSRGSSRGMQREMLAGRLACCSLLCVCAAAQRRVLSPGGLGTCWPRRGCVGEERSGDLRPPPLTKMRLKNLWLLANRRLGAGGEPPAWCWRSRWDLVSGGLGVPSAEGVIDYILVSCAASAQQRPQQQHPD